MKLYGAIASPYVTRVMMFAALKGVDLPLADVPGGSTRSEEYLAFSPIGKMPSLDVDGVCLPESEAICEFLEDSFPAQSGLPEDPLDRATSRLISRITDLYIAPHTSTLFRHMNPANRDQQLVDETAVAFAKGFGYAAHFMGTGPFCVGNEPTLGDCSLSPYIMLLKKTIFAAFSEVPDPTVGDGRLAIWWRAVEGHAVCKDWLDQYGTAVDGFMKGMGARISGQSR